jgi:hypothetical protein
MKYTIEEALRNMLGAFDTPLTRLKMGKSWTDFHEDAVKSARDAVNNGDPIFADEPPHIFISNKKCVHTEHCCAEQGCKYGDKDCPVWLGYAKQSYAYDDGIRSYLVPDVKSSVFEKRRLELKD